MVGYDGVGAGPSGRGSADVTNNLPVAYQAPRELTLPDRVFLDRELKAVREFQAVVQTLMVKGHDFGVIPGTDKPTLFKPGAEKIVKLLGLSDHYEIVQSVEDWDRPLFRYLTRCELRSVGSNLLVADCMGECNTMEARYRWRNAQRVCPQCGKDAIFQSKPPQTGFYCWRKKDGCGATFPANDPAITGQPIGRVENDDVYSLVNTVLKMSQKRALVGAALSAGRLSDVFTQDMEDVLEGEYQDITAEPTTPQRPAQAPQREAPTQRAKPVINSPNSPLTEDQLRAIHTIARAKGWSEDDLHAHVETTYDLASTKDLHKGEASELIGYIQDGNKPAVRPVDAAQGSLV